MAEESRNKSGVSQEKEPFRIELSRNYFTQKVTY